MRPAVVCLGMMSLLTTIGVAEVGRTGEYAASSKPIKNQVVYKQVGKQQLRLHVFRPAAKSEEPRPAIVFFFGGGWTGGSPSQFFPQCEYLASRQMVAISAEYRTKTNGGVSPFECVADAKSAIRYVRNHAEKLGVDPNRLAAGGGSAGGHLAAATATLPGLNDPHDDVTVSCRPNALVLFNPVYDNGPQGYGYERVKDRYREISPLHNLDKNTPPTIVFFGSKEKLITRDAMHNYKAKMEKYGGRCDLHIYPGQGHGFFNPRNAGGKYYQLTLIEADKFLATLDFIQGEPTLAESP